MQTVTKWLAVAVLMVSTAWAKEPPMLIGTIENKAGGQIMFTSRPCPREKDKRFVFIRDQGGQVSAAGCWVYKDRLFWVFWSDGDVFSYDLDAFEPTPDFEAYLETLEGVQS